MIITNTDITCLIECALQKRTDNVVDRMALNMLFYNIGRTIIEHNCRYTLVVTQYNCKPMFVHHTPDKWITDIKSFAKVGDTHRIFDTIKKQFKSKINMNSQQARALRVGICHAMDKELNKNFESEVNLQGTVKTYRG